MAVPGTMSAAEWTPSTASSMSTSSWHKKYVRNVAKGVSSLMGWSSPSNKDEKGGEPRDNGAGALERRPMMDWSPITYPSLDCGPALGFWVTRRTSLARRSKSTHPPPQAFSPQVDHGGSNGSASSGGSVLAESPLLHPRYARPVCEMDLITPLQQAPTVPASSSDYTIVKNIEALGVVTVKPYRIELCDLYGQATHQVEFKATHLLHSVTCDVLGIGETLVSATAAFTVCVYRLRTLDFMCDLPLHLAENAWMRYFRAHAKVPRYLNDSRLCALACPSEFGRRHGLAAIGSLSGLTQLWKIPDRKLLVLLPPPLTVAKKPEVVYLAFSSLEEPECCLDVACPDGIDPDISKTWVRRSYVWIFYAQGQAALWRLPLSCGDVWQPRVANGLSKEGLEDFADYEDIMKVGRIPPAMSYFYPCIEPHIKQVDAVELQQLLPWKESAAAGYRSCAALGTFADRVMDELVEEADNACSLLNVLECGDVVVLFLQREDEFAFSVLHPKHINPVLASNVTFGDLAIPVYASTPVATCYALLKKRRCIIVASAGVLRVIELSVTPSELLHKNNDVYFDLDAHLNLIATLPVRRRTEFVKAAYDKDFDELLLGLTTGEVVRIESFSESV